MGQDLATAVRCENVWKIYGADALAALRAARGEGFQRAEIHDRFNCIVAVADVSFSVPSGEVFCVMGLSGSGKSTLIRHINRLLVPTAGRILVGETDVNNVSMEELRRLRATKIGMVFQNVALFPHRTVLDNVGYGLEVQQVARQARRASALEKLELVGLEKWAGRYPDELSGGMQQRVGLARALAADPDILLMDEPFSALDPLIRRQLQAEFVKLSRMMKKTTLFITHDLNEATKVGDRIAIMRDGAFMQVGTPEEIVAHPADDYVAEFVRDISPLKVVRAHTVMVPRGDGDWGELSGSLRVAHDTTLEQLIEIAINQDLPIVILGATGQEVGVVTHEMLLEQILGRGEDRENELAGELRATDRDEGRRR